MGDDGPVGHGSNHGSDGTLWLRVCVQDLPIGGSIEGSAGSNQEAPAGDRRTKGVPQFAKDV